MPNKKTKWWEKATTKGPFKKIRRKIKQKKRKKLSEAGEDVSIEAGGSTFKWINPDEKTSSDFWDYSATTFKDGGRIKKRDVFKNQYD